MFHLLHVFLALFALAILIFVEIILTLARSNNFVYIFLYLQRASLVGFFLYYFFFGLSFFISFFLLHLCVLCFSHILVYCLCENWNYTSFSFYFIYPAHLL